MLTNARQSQGSNALLGRPGSQIAHPGSDAPPSFLGPRTGIAGIVEMDGELVVSGQVKGHIAALKLTIAADGFVDGDIVACEVVINGRMNGRVFAPTVAIEASAQVDARIFHTHLTVARGAHVSGRMPWRPLSYFETLEKLPEARP